MNRAIGIVGGMILVSAATFPLLTVDGYESIKGMISRTFASEQPVKETVSQATIQQEIYETELFNNWLHSVQPVSPSGMTRYEAQKTCEDLEAASWFMDVSVLMRGALFMSDNPHAAADAAVIKQYCPDFF